MYTPMLGAILTSVDSIQLNRMNPSYINLKILHDRRKCFVRHCWRAKEDQVEFVAQQVTTLTRYVMTQYASLTTF